VAPRDPWTPEELAELAEDDEHALDADPDFAGLDADIDDPNDDPADDALDPDD
jgi:hypothetical protein